MAHAGGAQGGGRPGVGGAGGESSGGAGGTAALPDSWFACEKTPDCLIWNTGCCRCPAASLSEAIAVRADEIDNLATATCDPSGPHCGEPSCAPVPDFVIALCSEGRCTAVDIRENALTACKTSDDCVLRSGTTCCQCGETLDPQAVAVNNQVDFDQMICGFLPRENMCPDCAPHRDTPGYAAECVNEHCQAVLLTTPAPPP